VIKALVLIDCVLSVVLKLADNLGVDSSPVKLLDAGKHVDRSSPFP
jgi:hypothetical protein